MSVSVHLSVRPSLTRWYSVETARHILKLFSLMGSHVILVFPHQTVLSPSFWVSRTTRYEGVSESEWVVYDDTVIFSNLPVYYTQSACVST